MLKLKLKSQLRFAVFTRVSTERQAERNLSLATQLQEIEQAVETRGHIVARYGGTAEHGTAGWERKEFDRLLADCHFKRFNAVMVSSLSRWSRDNRRSKEGLEILQKAGVRFFEQSKEFDLGDPNDQFILGITGEVNEFYAKRLREDIFKNRLRGARSGLCTSGTEPWGRSLTGKDNEGNGIWIADPEAVSKAQRWFRAYVRGKTFDEIGEKDGLDGNTIRRRLLRGGPILSQTFRNRGKAETVEVSIPGLLTAEEIQQVKERAQVNRLIRSTRTDYPLAHFVRCGKCGSFFAGHNIKSGDHYIRHYRHHYKMLKLGCTRYVPAKALEKEVFGQLGQILNSADGLLKAVQAGVKEDGQQTSIRTELKHVCEEIASYQKQQENLIQNLKVMRLELDAVEKVKEEAEELQRKLAALKEQKEQLERQVHLDEDRANFKAELKRALFVFSGLRGQIAMHWPLKAKQTLTQFVFGTKRRNQDGMGVFVRLAEDPEFGRYWTWRARGLFGVERGAITDYVDLYDQHRSSKGGRVIANLPLIARLLEETKSVKPWVRRSSASGCRGKAPRAQ